MVHELPAVGRNLQDHLAVNFVYRARRPTLNNELHPLWGKLRAGMQYVLTRRGPLSMSVNQGGGFVRSNPQLRAPDLQLYFNPASYTATRERTRRLMNPDSFPGFITSFNACRPTSRGHLEIRSADPRVAPAIYPNYLATEPDLQDVRNGTRLLRRLAAAAPLAAEIERELLPGPDKSTDDQLLQDFRQRAGTVFHPVSTCMMGPDPASAVVDARLRVHGIEGLRIIDASVFPTITSGNTNAPTAMVADKGAKMILDDENQLTFVRCAAGCVRLQRRRRARRRRQCDAGSRAPSQPAVDSPELARLGSYSVGVRTLTLVDRDAVDVVAPHRDRQLMVDIWYPATLTHGARPEVYQASLQAEPPAAPVPFTMPGIAVRDAKPIEGHYPLVIVSHGRSNATVALSWLTENLASKGYVVAAIRHEDPLRSDPREFPEILLRRPLDVAFVARTLQRSLAEQGQIDPARTALVGYSMGGYAVLTAAGGALDPDSAAVRLVPDKLLAPYAQGGAQPRGNQRPGPQGRGGDCAVGRVLLDLG